MSHKVAESVFGKFSVRLYRESDGAAHISFSGGGTRLNDLEYPTVSEATPVYRTVCDTVRDVLACIRQDPNVMNSETCEPGECVGKPTTSDQDYSTCTKCGSEVDMRG